MSSFSRSPDPATCRNPKFLSILTLSFRYLPNYSMIHCWGGGILGAIGKFSCFLFFVGSKRTGHSPIRAQSTTARDLQSAPCDFRQCFLRFDRPPLFAGLAFAPGYLETRCPISICVSHLKTLVN
jgi:hypothetical protein